MDLTTEKELTIQPSLASKFADYAAFFKLRLASLVVFSAILGYLIAVDTIIWPDLLWLCLGGFLVTGSSNGYNQIIEVDLDRLMDRTKIRPLVTGRMTKVEAIWVASISGLVGIAILWLKLNTLSGILALISLILYVVLYTPLKQKTPWAVFVGAFPGAIPPMLGAIAATGEFGFIPGILFFVQFTWQFPHFWAIAWVVDADYRAGGFSLLPSKKGKSKESAFQIALYSLALIPFSLLPWWLEMTGIWTLIIGSVLGAWFFLLSYKLFLSMDDKDARKLMFASFVYLPIIQFVYVFDKI